MKNYKECNTVSLGISDVAALVLVGCRGEEGLVAEILKFGEDGDYRAYIADGETEIGSHYALKATFNHWLKVYDDENLVYDVMAKTINVYRAGLRGCIIQIIK